jgi:hypothetical protein
MDLDGIFSRVLLGAHCTSIPAREIPEFEIKIRFSGTFSFGVISGQPTRKIGNLVRHSKLNRESDENDKHRLSNQEHLEFRTFSIPGGGDIIRTSLTIRFNLDI